MVQKLLDQAIEKAYNHNRKSMKQRLVDKYQRKTQTGHLLLEI